VTVTVDHQVNSNPYNRAVIAEFRSTGGRVADFADRHLLLLTTTGARTGATRTTPLVYLPDGPRLVVFAANGGAPESPAWYHNLIAAGGGIVEVGEARLRVRAVPVEGAEREELWARQIDLVPQFAEFRRATGRVIPVVALVPEPAATTG
jgi:deazaflavin-dependent oxidoreductase (nitroreductase family)